MTQEEMVSITKKEYDQLKRIELHMDILVARGVDNWVGWCGVPLRSDFDTDEEYQAEIERMMWDV